MPDSTKLTDLPVEALLQELRIRAAARAGTAAEAMAAPAESTEPVSPSEALREFDDATIAAALQDAQKAIYGTDDRVDVFQLSAGPNLDDVDCVVALFNGSDVTDNGNGTS